MFVASAESDATNLIAAKGWCAPLTPGCWTQPVAAWTVRFADAPRFSP
jgi:hypothetical protein